MSKPENEQFVRSFARGLSVISALGRGNGRHTIASIATLTDLPRAVARRILTTLCALGYADTDGREFRLTPRVLTLGLSYLASLPYLAHAQQVLTETSNELGESCAMALLDEGETVFIFRIPTRKVLSPRLVPGSRLPSYATSPGRVLLSQLDRRHVEQYLRQSDLRRYTERTLTTVPKLMKELQQVAKLGYAWVDREFDPAIAGLSVPVRDTEGKTVAAVSVNVLAEGWTEENAVKAFLGPLRRAADCIRFD